MTLVAFGAATSQLALAQADARAQQLDARVVELYRRGHYAEAIPLAEESLAICERSLGAEHPGTASTLSNLAELYRSTGAYAKAEPLYVRALAINERALGAEHPGTASSLNNLAELYESTGAYGRAEPLLLRALAIQEKALGEGHPDTAKSLNNLALLYRYAGAYAKAEPLYVRALAIREEALGADHPDTALSLNNLASLYQSTGAYAKAEPLFERALAVNEKALGADHPATALSLNNLALSYQDTGSYAKAEPLYLRALAIREKALGDEHPSTGTSLNNLGEFYFSTGAYQKAEALYVRALAINEKTLGAKHPRTAISLNNLAKVYRSTGAFLKAEPLYVRALAIQDEALGADHPDTAASLNNLAELYVSTGAYSKAEPLLMRALAIRAKVLGADHPDTAWSLNNLAVLYQYTGAYAKAEPLYVRALGIREKALGADHPFTALSLNNLAALHQATGAYGKAEAFFLQALAIQERVLGADHPDTALSLNNLANVYWASGKYLEAESTYTRVQQIREANTSRYLMQGSEQRRRQYLQLQTGLEYQAVTLALSHSTPGTRLLGAAAIVQTKGRTLGASADSWALLRRNLGPSEQALLDQLRQIAAQRSTLSLEGPGSKSVEAYRHRLDDLGAQQEQLEAELSRRSAAFQQDVQPVTLDRVRQALSSDQLLIEWLRFLPFNPGSRLESGRWSDPHYAACAISRDQAPVCVDLGLADTIEQAVTAWRTQLRSPSSDPKPAETRTLYRLVMQPVLKAAGQLPVRAARLLLSPDGELNLVPFAALVDGQGQFFGQRVELDYLTSGRDLLLINGAQSPSRDGIMVVAAPSYAVANRPVAKPNPEKSLRSINFEHARVRFDPLPGTIGEATLLARLFGLDERHVAVGDAATESRVKQLHGPRLLHIATHGFFLENLQARGVNQSGPGGAISPPDGAPRASLDEDSLLRSGLALAGANANSSEGGEDGILTAAEFANLDLEGSELVVLSACDTGVGGVANGEGVYGLRRAIVLAGARSELVSLWKISDEGTLRLMGEYYRRLKQGEGRAQALQGAQQQLQNDKAYAHPYYWAAFVAIGDWRAMHWASSTR